MMLFILGNNLWPNGNIWHGHLILFPLVTFSGSNTVGNRSSLRHKVPSSFPPNFHLAQRHCQLPWIAPSVSMQLRAAYTTHATNKHCNKQTKYVLLTEPLLFSVVPHVEVYPIHLPRHPCHPLLVRNWVVSSYVNTFFCVYSHRILECQTCSRSAKVWRKKDTIFSSLVIFPQNLTWFLSVTHNLDILVN